MSLDHLPTPLLIIVFLFTPVLVSILIAAGYKNSGAPPRVLYAWAGYLFGFLFVLGLNALVGTSSSELSLYLITHLFFIIGFFIGAAHHSKQQAMKPHQN